MMDSRATHTPASRITDPSGGDEVRSWKERIAEIPDLRLAKVLRLRRAITTREYQEDEMLERMLACLENDVGVLCRSEADND